MGLCLPPAVILVGLLRYAHLLERLGPSLLNTLGLATGWICAAGLTMVGNFQVRCLLQGAPGGRGSWLEWGGSTAQQCRMWGWLFCSSTLIHAYLRQALLFPGCWESSLLVHRFRSRLRCWVWFNLYPRPSARSAPSMGQRPSAGRNVPSWQRRPGQAADAPAAWLSHYGCLLLGG